MKNFIFNFIVVGLIAGGFWWFFVPSTLPEDYRKAVRAVLGFAVFIFSLVWSWIDDLTDEFRNRPKR